MELATWLVIAVLSLISYSQYEKRSRQKTTKAAVVENSWTDTLLWRRTPIAQLMRDAYQKYSKQSRAFAILGTRGFMYILPVSVFNLVRNVPESVLETENANEAGLSIRPFMGQDSEDTTIFIHRNINRFLPGHVPLIAAQTGIAFARQFESSPAPVLKDGKEYRPILIHDFSLSCLSSITSRIFLGEKYANNPRWTQLVGEFAHGILIWGAPLTFVPRFVVRLIAPFIPTRARILSLKAMLRDDILAYLASDANTDEETVLTSIIDFTCARSTSREADEIATATTHRVLRLLFAANDTTALTFTQLVYDLLGHPYVQYAAPLLAEIRAVKEKHGNRPWTQEALRELRSLDSFIKESQRLHPLGQSLGGRTVAKPGGLSLPGSIWLPEGARIEAPVMAVHLDEENYANASSFDGWRFRDDRIPGSQPSDKFMSFGWGTHACPGRYLALSMLKLMAVELLEGWEWEERAERFEDWEFGLNLIPNMTTPVLIRRKEVRG